MFVEDVFVAIGNRLATASQPFDGRLSTEWYRTFSRSIIVQIAADRALSVNQCRVVLKIIRKIRDYAYELGLSASAIDQLLQAPNYRHLPYESARIPREVRFLGDNLLGLRCKADTALTDAIKRLGSTVGATAWLRPRFDWTQKIWLIRLNRFILADVETLLHTYRFQADPATMAYLTACKRDRGQPATVTVRDEVLLVTVPDDPWLAGWIVEISAGLAL